MTWRPHTDIPGDDRIMTALLATREPEDGQFYLLGIYFWRDGNWVNEMTGTLVAESRVYWWLPERELLQTLPAAAG